MSRFAGRVRAILRTAWRPAAFAVAAGLLLEALLPVGAPWLPAAAAGPFALLALAALAWGEWAERKAPARRLPATDERTLSRAALLERWSTPAQFGYAFGAAALLLLGFSVGLGLGHLAGFGS